VTFSAITGYLLTTFSHNFVAAKTLLMSLQNIYMTECSSTVLLTYAVKPDGSDVISEAWFTPRLTFPFSD